MKQKKVLSTVVMAIMLLSVVMAIVPTTEAADNPDYFVAGQVFVNCMPTDGVEVILSVPGQENRSNISYYNEIYDLHGMYKVGIHATKGQNVTFALHFGGNYVTPAPETLLLDQLSPHIYFNINLSITSSAPDISLVSPSDGSTVGSENQATLQVTVNDDDGHIMDVEFYDTSNNSIGTADAIPSGSSASVTWSGLSAGTTYGWYAVADDGLNSTQSSTWSFTTKSSSSNNIDTDDDDNNDYNPPAPPTANAGGPYIEHYVDEEIAFNASNSTGSITSYSWDFGDGTTGVGKSPTHAYAFDDNYTVVLTVTGGGGTDIDTTYAQIYPLLNTPPGIPDVNGPQTGVRNTEYSYTAQSYDPDFNATIQYTFVWGDGETTTTEFYPNGTATDPQMHAWTTAGIYTIQVTANDNLTDSETQEYVVYIDTIDVANIGYMTNDDEDEPYDTFHGTDAETAVEKQTNGTYLIDNDGDGSWDYVYDPETDTLTEYVEGPIESSDSMLQMLALGVFITIIFFLIIAYVLKKRK